MSDAPSAPKRQAGVVTTLFAAVLVAMVIGMVYRCHAVSQCADVCIGSAGYDLDGWDGCRCVEWELSK